MLNDYNILADTYQRADVKPDKQFSTLPTVLQMAGDLTNKTALDLGCGRGFFTNELARAGAEKVIGIDNSIEQISLAKQQPLANVEFVLGDMFEMSLPASDVVVAPYVLNYATSISRLRGLFQNIFTSLHEDGRLVAVVDLPTGKDLKKFGALHSIAGEKKDEALIEIQLFDGKSNYICTLHAVYFASETIESLLREVGFKEIAWHTPVVSEEGRNKYPELDWDDYVGDPELGYLVAVK